MGASGESMMLDLITRQNPLISSPGNPFGLLCLSIFIFTGHMGGDRFQEYSSLGLGILTFLPGFYEITIAYYSWRVPKATATRPSLIIDV